MAKREPLMKFSPLEVAHYFLSKVDVAKGDSMTPLKLQKLVYYAQAWHYTLFNQPLFDEKVEAWAHGPVVRSVWNAFKSYSTRNYPIAISQIKLNVPQNIPGQTERLLNDIIRIYGEHTGSYLESLTHQEKPWIDARKGIPSYSKSNSEITLSSMKSYYSTLSKKK